jgi:hypothetical protein
MVGRKSCEQKSIPESDRSGGDACADFAAAIGREYEFPAVSAYRSGVAGGVGVEETQ